MTKTKSIYLTLLAVLLSPMAANATPVEIEVGSAEILGDNYLVTLVADDGGDFSLQSFNHLTPTITFTSEADAIAAGTALHAAFPNFDWSPFISDVQILGDLNYPMGGRIPYAVDDLNYSYITINALAFGDVLGPFTVSRDNGNYFSFIQFEALNVPEPGTLALLGLGLVGMAARRRKTG